MRNVLEGAVVLMLVLGIWWAAELAGFAGFVAASLATLAVYGASKTIKDGPEYPPSPLATPYDRRRILSMPRYAAAARHVTPTLPPTQAQPKRCWPWQRFTALGVGAVVVWLVWRSL